MSKPLRYWVRRAVVSFPLWVFFVHEADTRVFDNGDRVFGNHEGMVLWTILFFLLWSAVDTMITDKPSHRGTPIRKGKQ